LGLGPVVIGLLSDYLSPAYGVDSLRQAMLYVLPAIMLWSSFHFYRASKTLREDLKAAPE
jgi:hypothetical protein